MKVIHFMLMSGIYQGAAGRIYPSDEVAQEIDRAVD